MERTSRSDGGGEDAPQDDDDNLDVTWVGWSGAADDIDVTDDETPKTEASCRGSIGGRQYV